MHTGLLQLVSKVAETYGTPTYVYDAATLTDSAQKALRFPNAYGLTVRYAMKASPNSHILKVSLMHTHTTVTNHSDWQNKRRAYMACMCPDVYAYV